MPKENWLRRRLHQLTADETEIEAQELQNRSAARGAESMCDCKEGQSVCVAGTIRLRPRHTQRSVTIVAPPARLP